MSSTENKNRVLDLVEQFDAKERVLNSFGWMMGDNRVCNHQIHPDRMFS